ncbi:MAG: glycerol-3-phosphate 1-O-acyltransferase PlsY [Chloroflexi bacterium]|nr:glycerol-3-phosphate 1-O-acyltransferase PlsY [Chloroflexota bacterium]
MGPLHPVAAVVVGLAGYAIGSVSSGYLVGKIYRNVDLRRVGSGSTGATNTMRTLGVGAGLLVAGLDILKGVTAVLLADIVFPGGAELRPVAQALAALGAVAGHCWPAFLEGRGGRGVATGFGALLVIASPAWLVSVAAFMVAIALTRMVSVGSLAAVAGAVAGYALFTWTGVMPFNAAILAFILAASAIVTWRHRQNIERILRGAEPRLGSR